MIAKAQVLENRTTMQESQYEKEIDQALIISQPGKKVSWNMPERLWNDTNTIRKLVASYTKGGWKVGTYDGQGTYALIFS